MLIEAIAELLPVAAAVALSPLPVVAVALALGGPQGTRGAGALALGWLCGLAAVTAVAFLAAGEAEGARRGLGPSLQVVLGLALLAAAARKWRRRRRPGEPAKPPGWMASLDRAAPGRVALIGAGLGANPKNIALAFAAGSTSAYLGLAGRDAAIAGAVFVLLGSTTILGALLARLIGGERVAGTLEAVKQFMLENNDIIMMVVFVLIGLKVLGDGLAGLLH